MPRRTFSLDEDLDQQIEQWDEHHDGAVSSMIRRAIERELAEGGTVHDRLDDLDARLTELEEIHPGTYFNRVAHRSQEGGYFD